MMKIEILKKVKNEKFLLILILNTLFFCIMAFILPIRFEENDDVVMLLFASGKYSGTPEPHLVFINYLYGLFLTFLYSTYSKIEWYTVVFAIVHIISLSVITWGIIKTNKKTLYKLLFLAIYYALEVRFILLFQFTTTSALCALGGVVLICSKINFQRILGVLLFVLAGLIRFDAALLVLLVLSPIFLQHIIVNHKWTISRPILFMLSALILLLVFKFIDYRSYQSNEKWKYYQEYNKLRGAINDNPNALDIMSDLHSGISKSDYELVLNFFVDPKVIDLKKIGLLNQQLKQVNHQSKIANIYPSLRKYTLMLFLLIAIWGMAFISLKVEMSKLVMFFSLVLFFFALCFISLEGSLKYRVFLSALLPFIFIMFITIGGFNKVLYRRIFMLLVFSFVILFSFRTYKIWKSNNNWRNTQFTQQYTLLNQYLQNENNSIVPFGSSLSIEYYNPFNVSKVWNENKVYFCSWVSAIPLNTNHFESYQDLVDKNAIFLAKRNANSLLILLQESILKNYGITVKLKMEVESKDYIIVKLYSVDNL